MPLYSIHFVCTLSNIICVTSESATLTDKHLRPVLVQNVKNAESRGFGAGQQPAYEKLCKWEVKFCHSKQRSNKTASSFTDQFYF